jgi:addiction module RelB/DinJ family antitoxin
MSQIPITVKIDADVKQEAQKLAQKLGLSLSSIVENKLREVVRERRVVFEEELVPNQKTAKELEKIETDINSNLNLSRPFNSFEELERHLNSLGHASSNS